MEDFDSMPAYEMFDRRETTEKEIASLLGQFVFAYSRFVTELHLCVAWLNDGKSRANYGAIAEDLAAANLLKMIDKQVQTKLGKASVGFNKYKIWLRRAHQLRNIRNTIMHSRWGIEPYGRHAIAFSTPVLVKPVKELIFTTDRLRDVCGTPEKLIIELNQLRKEYPL